MERATSREKATRRRRVTGRETETRWELCGYKGEGD